MPDGDHAAFVERTAPPVPRGAIRDVDGRVLGTHDGVHRFTVGQRKGLGLSSRIPLYVVGIDAGDGDGHRRPARGARARAADRVGRQLDRRRVAGRRVRAPRAQIRHRHREAAGDDHAARRRPRRRSTSTSRRPPSRPARRSSSTTATWCLGGGWIEWDVVRGLGVLESSVQRRAMSSHSG